MAKDNHTISAVNYLKKIIKHIQLIEKIFEANKGHLYLSVTVDTKFINRIQNYKITDFRSVIYSEGDMPTLVISYILGETLDENKNKKDIIIEKSYEWLDWQIKNNSLEHINKKEKIIIK